MGVNFSLAKKIVLPAIVVLFTQNSYGQEQKQVNNGNQNIYVDSAIFYFNKAKTANINDTALYLNGIRMIDSIPTDANTIRKIETVAEDFKTNKKFNFYSDVESALITRFLNAKEYYKAIDFGKEIINRYDAGQNPEDRILFLNTLADIRIPFRISDKLAEGFDFYTSKLKLYLQRNDSAAISICYYVHGGFYHTNGLNDLSIYYYKKSIAYININDTTGESPFSGISEWTNNTSVVGQIYNSIGDYRNAIIYSRAALNARLSIEKDTSNVSYIYKNIASSKILLNEMDSVIEIINNAITSAKVTDRRSSLANCYQVKGIYYLKTNQMDSSEFYLNECINVMNNFSLPANTREGILTPDYYLALVRQKQKQFKEAEELIKKEIPKLVNLRGEVLRDYKLLVEVYLELGDIKNANVAYKQYQSLQEELQADERKNRSVSFETEQKIAEAEGTIKNLETEKQVASITRNYLVGIAILLLAIALIIFNRFRIKKNANVALEEKNKIISIEKANVEKEKANVEKEKERSDNLLLNILPSEVAEELKKTGECQPKTFSMVTVMFADFKGFTNVSEKVSAELLVNEINYCFSAFDNILQKHKIEKIKTVGDAYMCASGLPTLNYTHAYDVVSAALEIKNFILNRKKEKESKGEIAFEIRIGIHTGPVVAGIVGIKKFSYDIWGDTVNLAARMEQSCDAGNVNISGNTYELVKDKFTCTHRGKIQAKNKGEIDMYFVELPV